MPVCRDTVLDMTEFELQSSMSYAIMEALGGVVFLRTRITWWSLH